MKLGLIARADNGGLGSQTWELYRHLKPHKTMVIDLSGLNHFPQFPERYPGAMFITGVPTLEDLSDFLQGVDTILTVETPYNHQIFAMARERGIKSALQYNFDARNSRGQIYC